MRLVPSRHGLGVLLAATALAGVVGLAGFTQHERAGELQQWRATLNEVASAKANSVGEWTQAQFKTLTDMASNPATQIYAAQVQAGGQGAQADYLLNQMNYTARRMGFETGGVALVNNEGEVVMASDAMPAIGDELSKHIAQAPKGQKNLLDMAADAKGVTRVAFAVPVRGVQADAQIGTLVGVRTVDAKLLAPQATAQALDVALVEQQGNTLRYLSSSNTAVHGDAIVVAQAVKDTPWNVLARVDKSEALAQADAIRNAVGATVLLMLAALGGIGMMQSRAKTRSKTHQDAHTQLRDQVVQEREKRLGALNHLVTLLVSFVDKRDPNAAEHSAHVADVAKGTAAALQLDAFTVENTAMAAQLMNLGKADVPTELLTRSTEPSVQDRDRIRSSIASTAALLEDIGFDEDVTEILRQSQERVDGSGPLKLKGEQILISARIIAAANALVGMLSPRSYRAAMKWDEVVNIMRQDAGYHFDRKVVEAMFDYFDHHGGQQKLLQRKAA